MSEFCALCVPSVANISGGNENGNDDNLSLNVSFRSRNVRCFVGIDTLNSAPSPDIKRGCEAFVYLHPHDASELESNTKRLRTEVLISKIIIGAIFGRFYYNAKTQIALDARSCSTI